MQRVTVSSTRPGMEVATNVFSPSGLLLLTEGTLLTQNYIKRLQDIGIISIYIRNPFFDDVEAPLLLSDETRLKASQTVRDTFEDLRVKHQLALEKCETMIKSVVDEVIANRHALVHLSDIRTHDNYTFGHSVNVCVLSVLIGIALDYPIARLRDLALGALMHDIGKMMIPAEILNKKGKLTHEELMTMRRHPELGFHVLRTSRSLSVLSAHAAYQHHERYDGSGYPRQMKGEEIHEFARIVAVADVYDALNCDRPYRRGLQPHEIYEIFMGGAAQFDRDILQLFLKNIAIFPVGSVVLMNSGDIAVVIKVVPDAEWRPTIRLAVDLSGKPYSDRIELDLREYPDLLIQKVLTEQEIFALDAKVIAI